MTREPGLNATSCDRQSSLAVPAFVSLIVGVASGLVGAIFRLALEQADRFRDSILLWAHGEATTGPLSVIGGAAAATALAASGGGCGSGQTPLPIFRGRAATFRWTRRPSQLDLSLESGKRVPLLALLIPLFLFEPDRQDPIRMSGMFDAEMHASGTDVG